MLFSFFSKTFFKKIKKKSAIKTMNILFKICQYFLLLLGKVTKLTYIEISVIFNLWFQGIIITLSSFAPLIVLLHNGSFNSHPYLSITTTIYAIIYIILFTRLIIHYKLPFNRAFNLCVYDLQNIAKKTHLTYQTINILIFIVGFLIAIPTNITIALIIYYKLF